jgi:deazaflavin-dependent oxidoreductase (nitroreductase family)
MPTYQNPRVRDAVRSFNKRVLNPVMLPMAGRRHWYAAEIRHTGRNSGKPYRTPVVAVTVGDAVLIPLPYGPGVDWLRNVVAAGFATIAVKGRAYRVVRPEVIDAAAAEPQLPRWRRWIFRASKIDGYVKLALT